MWPDGPEYDSYRDLMRGLGLERQRNDPAWREGDWCLGLSEDPDEPALWRAAYGYELDIAGSESIPLVPLPRLDQWLMMLEEAGVDVLSWAQARQGGYGYARERKCDGRCDETSGSHWHEDGEPVFAATHEEACARLWMALTGRTVTSG